MFNHINRKTAQIIVIAILGLLFSIPHFAQAGDKKINIQGKLTDGSHNPITGNHTVEFRLYKNENDAIGNEVWYKSISVSFQNGLFNVPLKDGSPSLDDLSFEKHYYLGIKVGTDGEMPARQVIGAAGYALGSLGDFDIKDSLSVTGNVGIGTTAPGSLLDLSKHIGAFDTAGTDIIFTPIQNPSYTAPKAKISGQVTNGDSRIGKLSFYTADNTAALIERMVIDEGNVGIGTSAPGSLLELNKNVGAFDTAGTDIIFTPIQSPSYTAPKAKISGQVTNGDSRIGKLSFYTADNTAALIERMVIDEGNVGIGTTDPNAKLHIWGTQADSPGVAHLTQFNNTFGIRIDSSGQNLNLDTHNSGVWSPSLTVSRVSGNVGIGHANPTEKLYVAGNIYCTGQYFPSDIILKTGVETLPMDTLSRVMKLNGVKFKWDMEKIREKGWLKDRAKVLNKTKARRTSPEEQTAVKEKLLADLKKQEQEWQKPQIGLIAQEIEEQFPELVKTYKDDSKAVDYAKFTAVLLEALKAQQQIIETLKKDMVDIKRKLSR